MDVIIYHNPDCGTSRNTLAMIRNAGVEPHVIEYLKTPPSRDMLTRLIARMGISARELLREKGTPYAERGLGDPALSEAQLLDAMMAHPILINRPIVVSPKASGSADRPRTYSTCCRRNAARSSRKTASAWWTNTAVASQGREELHVHL
jgi:arsenate reductase